MHRSQDQIVDELLVLQSQDGDAAALEVLLRRWSERIRVRAEVLCGDRDGGGEVAQRSMIAVARGIRKLEDPAALAGWIMRIVAHKASDWVRERARSRKRARSLAEAAQASAVVATGDGSRDGSRDKSELVARLRRALDAMASDRRALLVMHYAHGVPVEGLAKVLEIPLGTAKSRLFHARRELGRFLERDER